MPVYNADIGRVFDEITDLLEIQEANPFRVRAYRTPQEMSKPTPPADTTPPASGSSAATRRAAHSFAFAIAMRIALPLVVAFREERVRDLDRLAAHPHREVAHRGGVAVFVPGHDSRYFAPVAIGPG